LHLPLKAGQAAPTASAATNVNASLPQRAPYAEPYAEPYAQPYRALRPIFG
jgi:hypothetical protein